MNNNASARSLLFYKPNYELVNLEEFQDYYFPRQLYTLTPIVERIPVPVPVPVPVPILVKPQEAAQEEIVTLEVKEEVIQESEPIAPVETNPIAPVEMNVPQEIPENEKELII